MKKLMLLFACLFVLTSTGCKDKDPEPLESLAGTSWIAIKENVNFKITATLTFDATHFRLFAETIEDGERSTEETDGTYTYANSIVTLTPNLGGEKPQSGVATNDTITFKDGDDVLVFERQ